MDTLKHREYENAKKIDQISSLLGEYSRKHHIYIVFDDLPFMQRVT